MQRKGPLPGKMFAWCIPRQRFAGHFEYTESISCQNQLILDAWRRYLARGAFLPSGAPLGIHQGDILPECGPSSARNALRGCFIQRACLRLSEMSHENASSRRCRALVCVAAPPGAPRCGLWRRRCRSPGAPPLRALAAVMLIARSGTVRRKTERDRIMGLSNALYCDKVASMIFSKEHIAHSSATALAKVNADIAVVLGSCAVMSQHLAQKCMSACAVMSEHLAQGCFGLAAVASQHWAQRSHCVAEFAPITYRY